jgi:hypothetical protein
LTNPVASNALASALTLSGFSVCRGSLTNLSNLVDEQSRYQLYGSLDEPLKETITFHLSCSEPRCLG